MAATCRNRRWSASSWRASSRMPSRAHRRWCAPTVGAARTVDGAAGRWCVGGRRRRGGSCSDRAGPPPRRGPVRWRRPGRQRRQYREQRLPRTVADLGHHLAQHLRERGLGQTTTGPCAPTCRCTSWREAVTPARVRRWRHRRNPVGGRDRPVRRGRGTITHTAAAGAGEFGAPPCRRSPPPLRHYGPPGPANTAGSTPAGAGS